MIKPIKSIVPFNQKDIHNNIYYWDTKWKNNHLGWDMGRASPAISEYINQYSQKNAAILIPGCGNAYEAEYLIKKGFSNITVLDISIEAVSRLRERFQDFPQVQILNEDYFQHTGKYDLIIEQTFFCAISPYKRKEYAEHATSLLREEGKIIGLLFNKQFENPHPPFGGNQNEYESIFNPHFEIKTMEKCYNSISPRKNSELFIILTKRNEI